MSIDKKAFEAACDVYKRALGTGGLSRYAMELAIEAYKKAKSSEQPVSVDHCARAVCGKGSVDDIALDDIVKIILDAAGVAYVD